MVYEVVSVDKIGTQSERDIADRGFDDREGRDVVLCGQTNLKKVNIS